METRLLQTPSLSLRTDADGKRHLEGYAMVWNARSVPLVDWWASFDEFRETIPSDISIKTAEDGDIRFLFEHQYDRLLGRERSKTLTIERDDKGLGFDVIPPDFESGIVEQVERGDINQMSFGFRVLEDDWEFFDNDLPLRTLKEIRLYEISLVSNPAYPDTSAAVRSLEAAQKLRMPPAPVRNGKVALYRRKLEQLRRKGKI